MAYSNNITKLIVYPDPDLYYCSRYGTISSSRNGLGNGMVRETLATGSGYSFNLKNKYSRHRIWIQYVGISTKFVSFQIWIVGIPGPFLSLV